MQENRQVQITVNDETHSVLITTYKDGTYNKAIQTFDEEGIPYCRLTTNPGYALDEDVIALRDDYEMVIGDTRDALIEAGIIEKLKPTQQIPMGFTTATLYKIVG